jgi:hypothetical protein
LLGPTTDIRNATREITTAGATFHPTYQALPPFSVDSARKISLASMLLAITRPEAGGSIPEQGGETIKCSEVEIMEISDEYEEVRTGPAPSSPVAHQDFRFMGLPQELQDMVYDEL